MRMLPPVWPHACEQSICVEKLNIEYMTYFDDMDDFNRLTKRIKTEAENRAEDETLDAQLLRLQEALDGQRIGQQGFGGDSYILKSVISTRHRVQNGYLFSSNKMQIINSRSFYTKRLGTSDQYDFGSFKSSNSTATVSTEGRPAGSETRRSCRICTNGYEQFIPTKDADEMCFRDFALILTNKTRMKHDGLYQW